MCCCGENNKTVVKVAGILGIIQSIFGMILASVNIDKFFQYGNESPIIVQALDTPETVRILLVIYLILEIYWLISSAGLIVANERDHVCGIRQWLVSTSFIIIAEIIFPIVAISATVTSVKNGLISQSIKDNSQWNSFTSTIVYFTPGFLNSYIWMILTFGKGGLFTLITNIVMCVYTGRRVGDLTNQNLGHVVGPVAVPVTVVVPSQVAGHQPLQPYYPAQGQLPRQPYYPAAVYPGPQPAFQPGLQQVSYIGQQQVSYQPQQPSAYLHQQPGPYQVQQPGPYLAQQPVPYPGQQQQPTNQQQQAVGEQPPPYSSAPSSEQEPKDQAHAN